MEEENEDEILGVAYCVARFPSWPEGIFLGFLHCVVALGTIALTSSFLVPLMGGGNEEKAEMIETLLFVAAINTLMQTWFGTRLPVVVGPSYTFLIPAVSIAVSKRMSVFEDPHQRFIHSMRAIQGALIAASFFQMSIGFLGFWRIFARYLSPLSVVPLVTLTGLGLFLSVFPRLLHCVQIALPAFILLVLFQYIPQRMKSRGVDRFALIVSIGIAWAFAEFFTAAGAFKERSVKTQMTCFTNQSALITATPWIRVPRPFQWGFPSFNAGDIFAMVSASLVATVESTGTFIAASRFGKATPIPPSVLGRGVGWLGIGTLLDGFFGTGTGSTASVANAGLLGLTRVGSRRVVQISAGFMLFFSILGVATTYSNFYTPGVVVKANVSYFILALDKLFLPKAFLGYLTTGKFGASLASVPLPIVAAYYCILFTFVASAGLGFLQFCNLNSYRSMFIIGLSLCIGLSVPQYFNDYLLLPKHGRLHTGSTWFNNTVQVLLSSPATVAIIVAYFLDLTLRRGDTSTRRDSGRHCWEKFRNFNQDIRSEEFYSLPFNLNKFFPSL